MLRKLIDNLYLLSLQPIAHHSGKSSFHLWSATACLGPIYTRWGERYQQFYFLFFLHTLIDLTPVFSYVSLTFARKWLILAVWDLIRLGAVYKLNCSLRLTGCLFTVFTPDMHYDLGCVCVCVCVHKWVSIDIMSAPDGYSEHFFFFFFFQSGLHIHFLDHMQHQISNCTASPARGSHFWHYIVNKRSYKCDTSTSWRMVDQSWWAWRDKNRKRNSNLTFSKEKAVSPELSTLTGGSQALSVR